MPTMHHVLDGLCIIFTEVNEARLCLSETVATGPFKEWRSSGEQCSVYWVSFCSTDNGQIRVIAG